MDEGGGIFGMAIMLLIFYFFFSWVMARIGAKFGVGTFVEWCIPIYNLVLVFRCANMSGWNILWYFVPIANIVVTIVVWAKIAKSLGKSPVLYVLLIFFVPLVPFLIMAFDNSRPDYY
jgi:hypothetical protein